MTKNEFGTAVDAQAKKYMRATGCTRIEAEQKVYEGVLLNLIRDDPKLAAQILTDLYGRQGDAKINP